MADFRKGQHMVRAIATFLVALSVAKLLQFHVTSGFGWQSIGLVLRLVVTIFLVKKLLDGRWWTRWALVIKGAFGVILSATAAIASFENSPGLGIFHATMALVQFAVLMPLATSSSITTYCRERRSRP